MTVSNNYAPVVTAANGTSTVFTATWNALSASYVVVQLLNTTTGVYTAVTQGVGAGQYQVTTLTPTSLVITFNTAPASGNNVVISRDTAQTQTIPYTTSRGFQGSVEEGSFDALTNMVQELQEAVNNSIQVSLGDTTENLVLPIASLRANYVLAFDASGNVIVSTQTLAQIQSGSSSAAASATAAASSAASSATSATAAAGSVAALSGTSATNITIGSGAQTFTTQTGKNFVTGEFLVISSNANSTNYMHGQVTSYNSGTGALVMNITDIGGSGAHTDWNIMISGTQGPTGPSGALYTETSISSNTVATNGKAYVCTAGLTLTIPLSTGLTTGWSSLVFAEGGNVVIAPNASDKINGGTTGASVTINQGSPLAIITTDAAGNIYVGSAALPLQAANNLNDLGSLTTALGNLGFAWTAGASDFSFSLPAPGSAGNKVIIKFGTYSQPSTIGTVTFPVAFPNNCFAGYIIPTSSNSGGTALMAVTAKAVGSLTTFSPADGTNPAYYLAIGN